MTAPAESRSEPKAPSRLALWAGALAVALFVALGLVKLLGPKTAHVPGGIGGVRLGSTLDEAGRAMPGLAEAAPRLHRARARVFDEPATCSLALGTDDRVSHIECAVDPSPRLRERLLSTLRQLYGEESETREGLWLWQNDRASLSVRAPDAGARVIVESFTASVRPKNLEVGADR